MTSHPKKILLISSFFTAPSPGGGVTFSRDVASEWLHRGYQVDVLCADFSWETVPQFVSRFQAFMRSKQLRVYGVINTSELLRSHQLSGDVQRKALQILSERNPDEVHVHNFHGLLSAVNAVAKSRLGAGDEVALLVRNRPFWPHGDDLSRYGADLRKKVAEGPFVVDKALPAEHAFLEVRLAHAHALAQRLERRTGANDS